MKSRFLAGTCSALVLLLSACVPTKPAITVVPEATSFGTITISAGISHETKMVAHLYAFALKEAGYTVEITDTGNTRAEYLEAMQARPLTAQDVAAPPILASPEVSARSTATNNPQTVDITPDYTGNLLLHLTAEGTLSPTDIAAAKDRATRVPTVEPSTTASASASATASPSSSAVATEPPLNVRGMSSSDIISALDKALPLDTSLLNAATAENKDALVVTRATAEKYGINSIADIAKHCPDLTLGAPATFEHRSHGLDALKTVYGCEPKKFVAVNNQGELSDQLANDTVQIADIFTSSPDIEDNAFVVLEDNANNFIAQQIVPMIRTDEVPQGARDAINTVSGRLTTQDLVRLGRLTTGENSITHQEAAMFWFDSLTE
ncbi:ABC transporter substrate-binding protein [Rothia sp. ZJ932]|uniref:ABC transporter substrate-binding protein n=1 Tax=Rothia sp. ZJ932 TaxID=2810516 RepID=UPI0019679717|nr:ABC transporter substrate-binding protein [Rothia sp. ZJ932]QRZ62149.1 ABC transporter substrate-binding protein [Rothia sp. ZJ932]